LSWASFIKQGEVNGERYLPDPDDFTLLLCLKRNPDMTRNGRLPLAVESWQLKINNVVVPLDKPSLPHLLIHESSCPYPSLRSLSISAAQSLGNNTPVSISTPPSIGQNTIKTYVLDDENVFVDSRSRKPNKRCHHHFVSAALTALQAATFLWCRIPRPVFLIDYSAGSNFFSLISTGEAKPISMSFTKAKPTSLTSCLPTSPITRSISFTIRFMP